MYIKVKASSKRKLEHSDQLERHFIETDGKKNVEHKPSTYTLNNGQAIWELSNHIQSLNVANMEEFKKKYGTTDDRGIEYVDVNLV